VSVRVRRVYDTPGDQDGVRVLVDRLWPRGLSKEAAGIDEWPKPLTPSTELRRWYHGTDGAADSYAEFRLRYEAELATPEAATVLDGLRHRSQESTVTLLTASKNLDHSHAKVLADLLETAS
jgi:uncharacterized protein YeaO (DUF488 family)